MTVSPNDRAFHFEDRGNHSVLVFRPPLNDEWTRVHEYGDVMLQRVRAASSPRLLLDLGELEVCGSAVVAVMVNLWKELRSRGGVLAVYCPAPTVRESLSVSRLTELWDVHDDRREAERAVMGGYTAAEVRDRWGVVWLALLGLLAVAAMSALLVFAGSLGIPGIACALIGALSLLLATMVRLGVPRSVTLARAWVLVVAAATLLAMGFALGHRALAVWHQAVIAAALVAALALCWRAFQSLQPAGD